MIPAVSLNFKTSAPTLVQDKPCYMELVECIQAIWNRVCAWISELASLLFSWESNTENKLNLALRNQDCFFHMIRYLEPEEAARCESVAKSWKIDRIWQAQCANHNVTVAPASGRFKELFQVPEMAFGPKEWKKYFSKAGPMPPLPANIKSQIAELGETHTLTLIPKTVNDQPMSLNTFAPLAQKAGMALVGLKVSDTKYDSETVEKSLWVWMQKVAEPGSAKKTYAQVVQDYPGKLGKALYYTISIVAHFARHGIRLHFGYPGIGYVRTCDEVRDEKGVWYIALGGDSSTTACWFGKTARDGHPSDVVAGCFAADDPVSH